MAPKLRFSVRVRLFLAHLVCKVFGHRNYRAHAGNIGVSHCARCRRITDQLTIRRSMTKGDIEKSIRQFAWYQGSTFNSINWKKRVASLTNSNGTTFTVPLSAFGVA